MNIAQWFMLLQVFTCWMGAIGFAFNGQWWAGSVWFCYALANIGWFFIAGGKA